MYFVSNVISVVVVIFLIALEFLFLFILVQNNHFRISHKKPGTRKMIYQEMETYMSPRKTHFIRGFRADVYIVAAFEEKHMSVALICLSNTGIE